MGAWGILERQSDNGLDLLSVIVVDHLRKVDFAAFNVSEAVRLVNQLTMNEIKLSEHTYECLLLGTL